MNIKINTQIQCNHCSILGSFIHFDYQRVSEKLFMFLFIFIGVDVSREVKQVVNVASWHT